MGITTEQLHDIQETLARKSGSPNNKVRADDMAGYIVRLPIPQTEQELATLEETCRRMGLRNITQKLTIAALHQEDKAWAEMSPEPKMEQEGYLHMAGWILKINPELSSTLNNDELEKLPHILEAWKGSKIINHKDPEIIEHIQQTFSLLTNILLTEQVKDKPMTENMAKLTGPKL